ncbi:MAG: Gfo/Idh/MocA family oxidoreductase, partial [Pararheinheimera sp.]|nr:Gfo/Idh/MocA family oxidoreductase [Rheinheimera sp.]
DWRQLLVEEQDKVDVLIVLTPTPLHKDMVIEALRHGYPVVCEKALCMNKQEAEAIQQVVEETKGYLAVTYNYTGYPMVRELAAMIRQGMLGKICHIHAEMPQEGFMKFNKKTMAPIIPQAWRLKDQTIPTVSLDLGVHVHQMIKFLTGEKPQTVVATQTAYGGFSAVVDDVNCLAQYSHGITANIWYGKSALGHKNGLRVRVYGDDGSAEWFQMEPETLHLTDKFGHQRMIDRSYQDLLVVEQSRYHRFKAGHPSGFIEAFANYYLDIADEIINFKSGEVSGSNFVHGVDTSLEGTHFLEAISVSAKTKNWVNIDL